MEDAEDVDVVLSHTIDDDVRQTRNQKLVGAPPPAAPSAERKRLKPRDGLSDAVEDAAGRNRIVLTDVIADRPKMITSARRVADDHRR